MFISVESYIIFYCIILTALAHENQLMSSFAGNISEVMAMASSSKRDIDHSGQYNSAYDDQTTGMYMYVWLCAPALKKFQHGKKQKNAL